jgi:hypothetical protein
MEDEVGGEFRLRLPSKEVYEAFDQSLLDDIYEGIDPGDTLAKIMNCCDYLGVEKPVFKSEQEMNSFLSLIELKYLNQACHDWHIENDL